MEKPISLDGIKMHVASTADCGEVNSETLFEFTQNGTVVSAKYSGGKIKLGYLVGNMNSNKFDFRYTQVDEDGRLDGGYSTCEVSKMADGRIKILEHFKWESREGTGTNIFEEI
jgi:hypothetical protein